MGKPPLLPLFCQKAGTLLEGTEMMLNYNYPFPISVKRLMVEEEGT
jgi:hypothetical protein